MKIKNKLLGLIFAFILSSPVIANKCDKSGLEIMQLQKKFHSSQYEEETQNLTLTDLKSKNEEKRVLKRYTKAIDGLSKMVLIFESPSNIKGTALLTHELASGADNQWLYLPELRKTQRIAPGGKRNYFMGTDFTFADLEEEDMDQYKYDCQKKAKCGPYQCYLIEALPKTQKIARNTGYSKRKLWIRDDIIVTVRVAFYDIKGSSIKTLTNSLWKKFGKTAWRPQKSVMKRNGIQQTTIETINTQIDKKIDDVKFEERYLLKGMHL